MVASISNRKGFPFRVRLDKTFNLCNVCTFLYLQGMKRPFALLEIQRAPNFLYGADVPSSVVSPAEVLLCWTTPPSSRRQLDRADNTSWDFIRELEKFFTLMRAMH